MKLTHRSDVRRRRPSAALIVAGVAVVLSTTGSAIAAKLITGKQIKDGTIAQRDLSVGLQARILQGGSRGAQGPPGPSGPPGAQGPPGAAGAGATTLWAIVDAGGALVRGSGATQAFSVSNTYRVVFDRDITACARIATIGYPTNPGLGNSAASGQATTELDSFYTDRVIVTTFSGAGGGALRPFHVALFCP